MHIAPTTRFTKPKKAEHKTYITREPGIVYFRSFDDHCKWGNKVKLYKRIIAARKPRIHYYICCMSKTFATQTMARIYTHHILFIYNYSYYCSLSVLMFFSSMLLPSICSTSQSVLPRNSAVILPQSFIPYQSDLKMDKSASKPV